MTEPRIANTRDFSKRLAVNVPLTMASIVLAGIVALHVLAALYLSGRGWAMIWRAFQ